jgi:hypothetical protein
VSRLRALLLLLVATAYIAACASATQQGQSGQTSGSGSRLTRTQLEAANSNNVYDAIVKLRPEWLSSRGPTSMTDATPTSVSVFMGGTMLGKADYLKQLNVIDVTEVRYWNPGQASARFGMGHPRGVLEIFRNDR